MNDTDGLVKVYRLDDEDIGVQIDISIPELLEEPTTINASSKSEGRDPGDRA